jgi:hypothetical protein
VAVAARAVCGAELQQIRRFADTVRTSPWGDLPAIRTIVSVADDAQVGVRQAVVNVGSWSTFFAIDATDVAGVRPDIPLLDRVRVP